MHVEVGVFPFDVAALASGVVLGEIERFITGSCLEEDDFAFETLDQGCSSK